MKIARTRAAGFTLVELLIVVSIIALLASISIALYRNARVQANEAGAVAALRAINDAQFAFAQTCGNQRYSPTLAGLGVPVPATGKGYLGPDLAVADPVVHQGYTLVLTATVLTDDTRTCNAEAAASSYQVTADPLNPGLSGVRFFGTNTDRAIFDDIATFVGNMPENGAPGHGSEIR
jgi:prepilin-type N-terminal cleavage/methylation domain-containing protein